MLRYLLAAAALKTFSATPSTKRLYRALGNTFGSGRRTRAGLPRPYIERARGIVDQARRLDLVHPGDRLLELGTGWLHWESTVLRLFFDVEVTLFDVWDNRQFEPLQRYFHDFAAVVDHEIPMTPGEAQRVHGLLDQLARTRDFDEAYALLGHRYVVNPAGTIDGLPSGAFNLVFSASVLEHVPRQHVRSTITNTFRVLRPGGHSAHLIDLGDHIAYYDPAIRSLKNYLRYSDPTWRLFFENDVQYFNRVQPAEWLSAFADAGFELIDQHRNTIDLTDVTIAEPFRGCTAQDLATSTMNVVHRKRGPADA